MRRPAIILITISFVWGSTWIPNEYLAGQGTPCALAALRYASAAGPLAIIALINKRYRCRRTGGPALSDAGGRWFWTGIILGLTMFAAPNLLLSLTARHGAGAWTPLLYAGLPLGLSMVAGELQVAAIVGVGAMFALLNGSLPLTAGKLFWALPTLGAVGLQGWSLLYVRRHLRVAVAPAGVAVQFAVAAVVLGLCSLCMEPAPRIAATWNGATLIAFLALGVLATAAAYPFYYRLLGSFSPEQVSISQWLQTLVGVAEGAWILRQRPGWTMLTAAVALVSCAWLLLRDDQPAATHRDLLPY
jgi:drug/metabolite transporter (DMT)-like permease